MDNIIHTMLYLDHTNDLWAGVWVWLNENYPKWAGSQIEPLIWQNIPITVDVTVERDRIYYINTTTTLPTTDLTVTLE